MVVILSGQVVNPREPIADHRTGPRRRRQRPQTAPGEACLLFVGAELLPIAEGRMRVEVRQTGAHQLAVEEGTIGEEYIGQGTAVLVDTVGRLVLQTSSIARRL